jgi:hypothetical protein
MTAIARSWRTFIEIDDGHREIATAFIQLDDELREKRDDVHPTR